MELVSNSVLGDLVSRSISFLLEKWEKPRTAATVRDDLQRLRCLLLQSGSIVEEAEKRLITNRAMLQQLKALRDETFRGHYILDSVGCRDTPGGDTSNGKDGGDDEANRRAFALSRFNPAKRVRFPSGDSQLKAASRGGAAAANLTELPQVVCSLEAMIGDTKEFVVFLMSCPTLYRQPYSAHLFVHKCMFGRNMEAERLMEFLLQAEPPGAANLGVLPIVGPPHIGKSTLVEHVCSDERVRNHFSLILVNENGIKDDTISSFKDNCVIKHRNDNASEERLLIVIELVEDVGEETWERLYSSERSLAQGSKMIITSRSEEIVKFGTTEALRLKCLSAEAYWYLFKMAVFGSEDPGQHPKLASLALGIANVMQGSFLFVFTGAELLRANFNVKSWAMVLTRLKQYLQKNVSVIGDYPDDVKSKDQARYGWSLMKQKPDKYFMLNSIYQRSSAEDGVDPDITMVDLMSRHDLPLGRHDVLCWESRIPPYFKYISTCEICNM